MTPTVPVITLQCEELKTNVVRKCQEEGFKNENWLDTQIQFTVKLE